MGLINDLRFALRQCRRNAGFVFVTVLVLTLGIGVSTAMFTVLNGVLFSRPAFRQINRLVSITEPRGREWAYYSVNWTDIQQWRAESHSFEQLAYYRDSSSRLERANSTEQLDVMQVSGNLFSTLGVPPQLGRVLTDADESEKSKVVVLGNELWTSRFNGDPHIVGQSIKLDGGSYEVLGVMPKNFTYPLSEAGNLVLWSPLALNPAERKPGAVNVNVLGRLRDGVSIEQARAELNAIQRHIYAGTSDNDVAADKVEIQAYWDSVVGSVRPALLALAGAVALVWLVACANVGGLMLIRNSVREREIAVRSALGASRTRLVRQLVTEGLFLSIIGSVAGLGVARLAVKAIKNTLLDNLGQRGPVSLSLDWRVLAATIALSIASTLVFALIPAVEASRKSARLGLQGKMASAIRSQHRMRNALVVAEVMITMVLLVSAGLLMRTLWALHHIPLGFRSENVVTTGFTIPKDKYVTVNVNTALYEPLVEKLKATPGVRSAAITSVIPLIHRFSMKGMFDIVGRKTLHAADKPQGDLRFSSPEYPAMFGIPMERGRFFDASIDTPTSQPVVVVNHTFVEKFLHGEDPLKFALHINDKAPWDSVPIIGVIGDVRERAVDLPPGPEIHLATSQVNPGMPLYPYSKMFAQIAVRTSRDPEAMIPAIRTAAHDIAPEVATGKFSTMTEVVEDSFATQTFAARLIGIFASTTLLIALSGLYGTLRYAVVQRQREIGVRMALGASRADVIRMVLRKAALLVVVGIAAGTVLSIATDRFVRSYLYGVQARDVFTIVSVGMLLAITAIFAAYLPARKAACIDPIQVLRSE